jgi:hypothetical protein
MSFREENAVVYVTGSVGRNICAQCGVHTTFAKFGATLVSGATELRAKFLSLLLVLLLGSANMDGGLRCYR